jgi:hypothetical protein
LPGDPVDEVQAHRHDDIDADKAEDLEEIGVEVVLEKKVEAQQDGEDEK